MPDDDSDNFPLAVALTAMGCPAAKSREMAAQLDKRARQLMTERGGSYEHAMAHLLGLMKQGWAAQAANGGGVGSQESGPVLKPCAARTLPLNPES